MPEAVLAAAMLAALGVRFVLVGSTALWLWGGWPEGVKDLDVVPELSTSNLHRLGDALAEMGESRQGLTPAVFTRREIVSVVTAWGPVDVLCQRARDAYVPLDDRGTTHDVLGVPVHVASHADALMLRAAHKDHRR